MAWDTANKRWTARIGRSGKQHNLGYFEREDEAARAYDAAATRFFGELARSNETLGLFERPLESAVAIIETEAMPSRSAQTRSVGLSAHSRRDRTSAFRSR